MENWEKLIFGIGLLLTSILLYKIYLINKRLKLKEMFESFEDDFKVCSIDKKSILETMYFELEAKYHDLLTENNSLERELDNCKYHSENRRKLLIELENKLNQINKNVYYETRTFCTERKQAK